MTSQHLEVPPEPSDKRLIGSAISWIGVILIFALIVFVAYLPRNEGPLEAQVTERRQKLADDVRRQESALVQSYAKNADGTFRVPVAVAMDLAPSQLTQGEATSPEEGDAQLPAELLTPGDQ